MKRQSIGLVSLVVRDYDEALNFFVGVLGFTLVQDTLVPKQSKRWVVVSPPGSTECGLLLARASTPEQESRIGCQTGGRVFLFLYTDDFWRDYESLKAKGVAFVRDPREHPYGIVLNPPLPATTPKSQATFDIRAGARVSRVHLDDIVAITSAGNYVEFKLRGAKTLLMRSALSAIEQELAPSGFLRTHRSWLVNAKHVRGLVPEGSGDYKIELEGFTVPLSRRFPEALAKLRGT
jgi:catechol 2,3-dioxygenase-like lactoylglutathione lyase family enzyme